MQHFGKDAFVEHSPAGDRPRARDSLFLAANLRSGTSPPIAIRVRNLSAGGLMAELPHPIPVDRAIEVEVRGLGWVAGRIAWQTEGRAGIAFDQPIDPQRARKPVGQGRGPTERTTFVKAR